MVVKLKCKEDCYDSYHYKLNIIKYAFLKDEWYEVDLRDGDGNGNIIIFDYDDGNDFSIVSRWDIMKDLFYTKEEIRQQKIKKLLQ